MPRERDKERKRRRREREGGRGWFGRKVGSWDETKRGLDDGGSSPLFRSRSLPRPCRRAAAADLRFPRA